MKVIACTAPYGKGGLGQHLAQIVDDERAAGNLAHYFAASPKSGDDKGSVVEAPWLGRIIPYTPLRLRAAWKYYAHIEVFDRAVAKQLPKADEFSGFVGQALNSFRRARKLGYTTLELEAANSHVTNVMRLHSQALRQFPIGEDSWLDERQARKTINEYNEADIIYAASEYTRKTLLNEGIPDSKIRMRPLRVNPRFDRERPPKQDDTLRVVYVGSLTVMKGIPVLVEAFRKVSDPNAKLTLVGGWATRAMRQYLEKAMREDPRISVAPGDPQPHLLEATVCVHPTYEDGFAYAPMEALCFGVPVIVTEDTGMKEYVIEGKNGYIVPTGSVDAIYERLKSLGKNPTALDASPNAGFAFHGEKV